MAGFILLKRKPLVIVGGRPTYVGSTAASMNASGNLTLTLPGGMQQNDLVVITTGFSNTVDGDPGVSTAGYTEVADIFGNDSQKSNMSVCYKFMGSTPDTTATCLGSQSSVLSTVAICQVWRGVNTTTPMDVTAVTATGINGAVADAPAITPTTSLAVVLACMLGTRPASTVETPTGPANMTNFVNRGHGAASHSAFVCMASYDWTSGAFDPDPLTTVAAGTSASWSAVTLALRPA